MEIILDKNEKSVKCVFENVFCLPFLQFSLLSTARLIKKEMEVSINFRDVGITENKILCATGT